MKATACCYASCLSRFVTQLSTVYSVKVPVGISVSLFNSISPELRAQLSANISSMSPAALAGSSSGGVAIRYALPILWTTSRFLVPNGVHGPCRCRCSDTAAAPCAD